MSRRFNGSTNYVRQYNLPSVATGSISMWIRAFAFPGAGGAFVIFTFSTLAESPPYSTFDKSFYIDSSGRVTAYIYDGGAKYADATSNTILGKWHHILMTIDGSNLRLYQDGVLHATSAAGNSYTGYGSTSTCYDISTYTQTYLRGGLTSVNRFNGEVADIGIWNGRVLQASHALALAKGMSPMNLSQSLVTYTPLIGKDVGNLKLPNRYTAVGGFGASQPLRKMNQSTFPGSVMLGKSSGAASLVKTINGLARSSVKTVNGLAIASVKTINGLS